MRIVREQPSPETISHWKALPPPNAKRQKCEHCGRMYYIVCRPDQCRDCGQYQQIAREAAE